MSQSFFDFKEDVRPPQAIRSCESNVGLNGEQNCREELSSHTTKIPDSSKPGTSGTPLGRKKRVVIIHGDPNKPNNILPGGKWDEDDFEAVDTLKKALEKLEDRYEFSTLSNHDTLITDLQRMAANNEIDLVLQLCDEGFMNHPRMELHITALLEMLHIPFTGTGAAPLGATYDKQAILETASSLGIPIPGSIIIEDDSKILEAIRLSGLEYPLFVKPNATDGSYGVTQKSVCRTEKDVLEALKTIREVFYIRCPVLVQEFLEGVDVNTAMLGNPETGFTELPVTEEDYSEVPAELPRILGFENKWDEQSPYWRVGTIRARSLSTETISSIMQYSRRLFQRIKLRDYARFDWKCDSKGRPRLLEVNPNCGWSYDAHLQRMCAIGGISYSEMLRRILEAAEARYAAEAAQGAEKFVSLEKVSSHRLAEKQLTPNQRAPLLL